MQRNRSLYFRVDLLTWQHSVSGAAFSDLAYESSTAFLRRFVTSNLALNLSESFTARRGVTSSPFIFDLWY